MCEFYALKGEVYYRIALQCPTKTFYNKWADKIYWCYRREYEPYFGEKALQDIPHIVQEFYDMFGEE